MNFWFNGGAILAIAFSNLLYDLFGGHWIVLALIWPFGFALHGITVHLFWTIRQRNLSPGLVTSVLYWIVAYFFVRYGFLAGHISLSDFWIGFILVSYRWRVSHFRSDRAHTGLDPKTLI